MRNFQKEFEEEERDELRNLHRKGCIAILIAALFLALACSLTSCKSVQSVTEINYKDSTIVHHDTTHTCITDTNRVEKHVAITDTTHILIQFGAGGGTYNAHTGQATNVAGVQQTQVHNEQRDSTSFYKHQVETLAAVNDSLSSRISDYKSELAEERDRPKRTGWDRFCTWYAIISWILMALALVWWLFKKFYLRR
ncbi:MAG: hypothetical protein IJ882_08180 [Paludibacteraceae bacterium]|nr:hypothetical protein [Paludibacteraceae bacterium]MBR3647644.1 hypothetical protein [Paludibacteraceae bacterium]